MENDELPDVPVDLKPGVSPDLLPSLRPAPSVRGGAAAVPRRLSGRARDLGKPIVEPAASGDATLTEVIEARSFRTDAWRRFRKNKLAMFGLVLVVVLIVIALIGPFFVQDPLHQERTIFRTGPDAQHWLGTDQVGRDVLARAVYGIRLSLFVGFVVACNSRPSSASASGRMAGWPGLGHRCDHHALHRHHARHPVPRVGVRVHRGDRPRDRRRDPHARAVQLVGHRSRRARRLHTGERARVRRGGAPSA